MVESLPCVLRLWVQFPATPTYSVDTDIYLLFYWNGVWKLFSQTRLFCIDSRIRTKIMRSWLMATQGSKGKASRGSCKESWPSEPTPGTVFLISGGGFERAERRRLEWGAELSQSLKWQAEGLLQGKKAFHGEIILHANSDSEGQRALRYLPSVRHCWSRCVLKTEVIWAPNGTQSLKTGDVQEC